MLTQTAFQPLYGRLSDIIGRQVSLLFCIIVSYLLMLQIPDRTI